MSNNTLVKSVGLVTIITIIGKLLGFGRETFMAAYFGTSYEADLYYVASVVPNILFAAIGMAITTGMIPLYIENKKKNPKLAYEEVSALSTLFIVLSFIVTSVCMIFTYQLVKIIAPGFQNEPEHMDLAVSLTRIILPVSFFLVLSSLAQGILNANKKFLAPAMVTIPNNLIIIGSIILFTNSYGIYGVAVGTLLGGISQYLIQYPSLKNDRIKLNFQFKKHKKYIINNLKLFFPIIIAGVTFQFIEIFNRILASGLNEGSISALNYSMKLMYLPLSVLLMSIITVIFPNLVEAANNKTTMFKEDVWKGFITLCLITLPIAVVMIIEAVPLVKIVFERGAFTEEDTQKTAHSFIFYSAGLIFIASREYLVRCFLAIKASKIIMVTSVISLFFNISISFLLSKIMGHGGIALGTSLSFTLQTFILLIIIGKKLTLSKEDWIKWGKGIIKLIILSLFLIIGSLFIHKYISGIFNSFIELLIMTSIIFTLFFLITYFLKFAELVHIFNNIRKKFIPKRY
ncbi:murein biosynthesis integral membrane protein MurJ [Bacillus alveayuensis]|uniref:murein biosynthesis integral membrane protein MurJ n=1 Tax=Aeribacillus alveayuensis TaxID=279215 RepID=UPI0005CCD05A|nr:murein biosynthesis integral membrane protein MurJ [Bacillus alveayuensis]